MTDCLLEKHPYSYRILPRPVILAWYLRVGSRLLWRPPQKSPVTLPFDNEPTPGSWPELTNRIRARRLGPKVITLPEPPTNNSLAWRQG